MTSLKFKIFFHFWISICVHTLLVDSFGSPDWRYEACKPKNCRSGPNISYPFQIIEKNSINFCGYPGFEVVCEDNKPLYATSRSKYIVEDIFYDNDSFRLVNIEVINSTCPSPQTFFSFDRSSFEFGPNFVDLYLFYHCNEMFPYNHTKNPIACASNDTHKSFAVLDTGKEDINSTAMPCESYVRAPVELEGGQQNQTVETMDYTMLLRNGFVLEWSNAVGCRKCEKSGGCCGFNNSEIVCYCRDGEHSKHCNDGRKNLGLILGTAIPGALFILILCSVIFIIWRRKKWSYGTTYFMSRNISSDPSSTEDLEGDSVYFGVPVFSYSELEEATNNFDSTKELGDGGFGTVYYGKLRDGREVAVKRLYEHNYKRVEQFMNEVEILTRLHHKNLALLYGCTSRRSRELLLVYEYIPNGTVADHLHGDRAQIGSLTWPIRMNIAIETASALTYLHHSDIIHRDVKTTNILLDNNFCVKVADFGLSRLLPTDVSHVSTAPQGTPGYVDPEYHQCYQLTEKSDVYSFGVVLVELISSMPAVDISRRRHEINLANLALNKIQNCAFHELIDPCLGFKSDALVERMTTSVAVLAFRCLQLEKEMRPTMDEVLEALKGIQGEDYKVEKTEEVNDSVRYLKNVRPPPTAESEKVVLLKNNMLPPSPDSVTEKWFSSRSTIYSTSG